MIKANNLIDEEATKIEEEDSSTNNKNSLNETNKELIDINEDQEKKKELFKSYLFSKNPQNISTPDLFSQIVDLIKTSNTDDLQIRDSKEEEEIEEKEEIIEEEPEFVIDDKGKKKYKHFYRGVVQLMDFPPKKNTKKIESDDNDSYYSD